MEEETLEVEQSIKLVFKKLTSNQVNLGSSDFSYSPEVLKTTKEASKAKGRVGTKRSRSIDVKNDVSPVPSKKIKTLNPGNGKSSDPVSTVLERTPAKNERLVRPSKHRPSSTSKHMSRTKRCEECEGCTRLDCGTCQSCRINHQFKHQIKIGRAECLKKVCTNPILLTYQLVKEKAAGGTVMSSLMQEQDDAACPFKMIDGQLYDFRCVFCKKLPRAGMANRSELYRHYSLYHFSAELMEEFKNLTRCPVPGCNKAESGKKMADHMGQVHNEVDKYIPVENRIPLKKPASRSGGKGRAAKAKVVEYVFPEIPPGYNPATRTVENDWRRSVWVQGFQVRWEPNIPVEPEESFSSNIASSILYKYKSVPGFCVLCDWSIDQPMEQLIYHLEYEHALSLDSIEEEDIVKYLEEVGYIRLLGSDSLNPTEQISDLASLNEESTIQQKLIKDNLVPEDVNQDCVSPEKFNQDNLVPEDVNQDSVSPEKFNQDKLVPEDVSQDSFSPEKFNQDNLVPENISQDSFSPEKFNQNNLVPENISQDSFSREKFNQDNLVPENISQDSFSREKFNQDSIIPGCINQDSVSPEKLNPDSFIPEGINQDNIIPKKINEDSILQENPENIPEKAIIDNTVRPHETILVNPEKDDIISNEESLVNFIPKQIDPEKQNQDQVKDKIFNSETIQDDFLCKKESRENLQLELAPSKPIREITEDTTVDETLPEKLNLYPESILVKPIQKNISDPENNDNVNETLPKKLNHPPEPVSVKPIQKDISDQESNDNVVNETLPEKLNHYNIVTEKQETLTEGDEKENVNPTN